MKISAINTIKYLNFPNKMNVTQTFKQSCDTFVKEAKNEEIELPKSIKRTRKFDIQQYNNLSSKEKEEIRERIPEEIKKAAQETIFAGKYIKDTIDKTYGKDKYVFCCVGTSPSGIGRFMEFSGVETKYFPISRFGMNEYFARSVLDVEKKGVTKYVSFLKKQGITQKDINKSDKKYLFIDYCVTGSSLKNFGIILSDKAKIYEPEKIKLLNINDLFKQAYRIYKPNEEDADRIIEYIKEYIAKSNIADFAGVPHLNIIDIKNVNKTIKDYSPDEAKLFNFAIIDELNKQGKLKENPLNKKSI